MDTEVLTTRRSNPYGFVGETDFMRGRTIASRALNILGREYCIVSTVSSLDVTCDSTNLQAPRHLTKMSDPKFEILGHFRRMDFGRF